MDMELRVDVDAFALTVGILDVNDSSNREADVFRLGVCVGEV